MTDFLIDTKDINYPFINILILKENTNNIIINKSRFLDNNFDIKYLFEIDYSATYISNFCIDKIAKIIHEINENDEINKNIITNTNYKKEIKFTRNTISKIDNFIAIITIKFYNDVNLW